MAKNREVEELEQAEICLRRVQEAKKRADTAVHKSFLEEIKKQRKQRLTVRAYKKISRIIVLAIKRKVTKSCKKQ